MSASQDFYIYAVELCDEVLHRRCRSCKNTHPRAETAVYVGESWYPPEVRLWQHCRGKKNYAGAARQHAVRLRADLVDEPTVVRSKGAARLRERELAADLCRRGYLIFGGH
jgi:hypothetical protein